MKACNFQTATGIDHLISVQLLRKQSSKIQINSMVRMSECVSLGLDTYGNENPRITTASVRPVEKGRRQRWRSKKEGNY